MRTSNLMIGGITIALLGGTLASLLVIQKVRVAQQRSPIRIVFDGSANGLRRGGAINFDGIQAGEIRSIRLDNPRKIVIEGVLDNSAPIRKDTVVGIEFQGLTGIAAISLVGGAPAAPPVPLDRDGIPVLVADLSEQQSIVDTLHNVDRVIIDNQQTIKDALLSFETYTASLQSKGEMVDRAITRAEDIFSGVDGAIDKVGAVLPGFADGKTSELYDKVRSLREFAETFKHKSANLIDESRRTLRDVSDAAMRISFKLDPQGTTQPSAPGPRRPAQQQPKRQ